VLVGSLALAPRALAVTFDFDPPSTTPKTGKQIKFHSSSTASNQTWDLDGDGRFDDATGQDVTHTYTSPGGVTVRLHDPAEGDAPPKTFNVAGPSASFASFPPLPLPGQEVTFVYSPRQGGLAFAWDLDADGQFNDGTEQTATRTFAAPGTYSVRLAVTDTLDPDMPTSTATQVVAVRAPDPTKLSGSGLLRLMTPFPIVRITGKVGRRGARIKRLTVNAPFGATVLVRCRGGGCPFRRSSRTVARVGRTKSPSRTIRIRKLEGRLLRTHASVKVFVSKASSIGKFTSFRIRRNRPPLRSDLCLSPGAKAPAACPQT
jgi:PKD repeat protein